MLWLALSGPALAQSGELRLTLPEARSLASKMLGEGRPEEALVLANGILLGAPNDIPGLILKSRALRDMGRTKDAEAAARTAVEVAGTDKDRFFAALVMAQAKASGGQRGLAQYWLRHAAQVAPDDNLKAVAVRDFRHVRRTTPWRASFAFSVSPADNINGAPKTNSFTLSGLRFVNPAAVPLSGLRYSAEGQWRYSWLTGPNGRVNLTFSGERERVSLSREARNKVPSAKNSDYSRDALLLGLEYQQMGEGGAWLASAGLSIGRDWQAGNLLSDVARFELGYNRRIGEGLTAGALLSYEIEKRHDLALRDSSSLSLQATVAKRFENGNRLQMQVQGIDTTSDSSAVASVTRRATLSYGLGKPKLGMLPTLSLSYEEMDFARPLYGVSTRQDRTLGLSLNVLLPEMDYYGFAPEVGVSFRDRRSNFSLFESESTDLRLGIRSVF